MFLKEKNEVLAEFFKKNQIFESKPDRLIVF